MSDYLQPQDLIDDKKHSTFFSEVITGKAGGAAGGANIDTAVNAVTSQTQKTMPKLMSDAELAFDAQLDAQQVEHASQISAHEIEHDNQISAHEVEHDSQIAAHEVEHDNQIAAHESEFISQLQAQGWNPVDGSFETGGTIVNRRDILWWETAKAWYSWQGALPKVVPAGSTPATAGGVSSTAWVDRTDGALRGEVDKTRFATLSKLISLDSYSGVIDPTLLLGLVVTTDWHNTSIINESRGGGARYQILTSAQYGATPDGVTVDGLPIGGDHYIGGGTSYVAKLLGDDNRELDIEMFGSYQGQPATYSTQAVNSAISYASGRKLYWPAKRIRYEGVNTTQAMCIVGRQRPRVADDKSALQNGSVLVGWCLWRPVWGCFIDLGVDHGSANFSTAADGLKISATGPTVGKWCVVHGCIGLGRDPEDATHAILVEGYAHAEITQVYGCRNYFGLAAKFLDGFINGVTAVDNGLYGVILKSDATWGGFRDVNVSNIDIVGTAGNTGIGLEIETVESTQMQRLNIVNVNARNVETALRINAASGVINDINISNVIGQNCSEDAIIQLGTVYNLVMSNIQAIACAKRAMNIAGSRFLSIDGFVGNANSGNTFYNTDFVLIQSAAARTMIDRLNLIDSSYTSADFGTIKYDNLSGQNQLGMYNAVKDGTGAPA